MAKMEFSMNLPAPPEKLLAIAGDYKNFSNFLESQIKSVKVLKTDNDETITEEVLTFSTYVNHEIVQRSIHRKNNPNVLYTKIISGPFKESTLQVSFEKMEMGTKVTVNADLKLGLKYRMLGPIIKKRYKTVIIGLLYKMNNMVLKSL